MFKVKEFNLYKQDILYREGILEVLKKESDFDTIIIYEKIEGEISFSDLIDKIKNINSQIKIIFILENNNLENLLKNKNIKNIFYNDRINFNDFISKIKNINSKNNNDLMEEIKKLKLIISEKENELNKYKNKIINLSNNNFKKILIISDINFYQFQKFKSKIEISNTKLDYLDLKNINKKIKRYNYIIFLVNLKLGELKKTINIINCAKEEYFIENKKINIIFIQNKDNLCNTRILKNIFYDFNILGKIKKEKHNYEIKKSVLKKINNLINKEV